MLDGIHIQQKPTATRPTANRAPQQAHPGTLKCWTSSVEDSFQVRFGATPPAIGEPPAKDGDGKAAPTVTADVKADIKAPQGGTVNSAAAADTKAATPASVEPPEEEEPIVVFRRNAMAEILKIVQANNGGAKVSPEALQKGIDAIQAILSKEVEKRPPIEFNGDAMRLMRGLRLLQCVNPVKDTFAIPLAMQLLSKDGVTSYLKGQGLNPNDLFDTFDRFYGKLVEKVKAGGTQESLTQLTADDVRDMARDIQKFAHKEGLQRISDVTIWRWLMHRNDPQVLIEKVLQQGGVQPDMISRMKKAPNTEKNNLSIVDEPERPTPEEIEKLDKALEKLPGKVIGQKKALEKMLDTYETSKLGYNIEKDKPMRPKVRQLLLGPSGVGKTFAVEQLAKILERPLIYVPLNEFIEDNSVNRFTGAPPGYTGYGDGNSVADQIIRAREDHVTKGTPLPIVLFDEIEKASPKVFDVLMQVLDKGEIHNGTGEAAFFKGIDIFMTSNIGQKEIAAAKDRNASEDDMKAVVTEQMKKVFRPEFIGRIDEPVIFGTLNREDASKILDINLGTIKKETKTQDNIEVEVDSTLKEAILDVGYTKEYGVRKLKDMVESMLHRKLVKVRKYLIRKGALNGKLDKPIQVKATYDGAHKDPHLTVNGEFIPEIFKGRDDPPSS